MKAVLGVDAKRFTSARGAGNPAADADVRFFSKQEGAGGIVQQFPGKRENRGVLGVNGEHTLPVVGILKAIEQTLRGAVVEHGFEERLADFGQPGLDATGFLIVRIGQRLGAVRFDVPADVGPILLGDGIGEVQFPGIRAVERDVGFGIARKIEREFRAVHLDLAPVTAGRFVRQAFNGVLRHFPCSSRVKPGSETTYTMALRKRFVKGAGA